jgi:hypothetical protein
MESFTMGTLIRMAIEKELESEYLQMVTKIMENGILINNMGAIRWNGQMVAVGGGNSRMVKGKDMQHMRGLVETDTSGNTWIIAITGMEYTDGLMEEYITENGNRISMKAKDISGGQMEMNIGESARITCNGERESNKRREYFTETSMMESSSSAGFHYSELIKSMISNKFNIENQSSI